MTNAQLPPAPDLDGLVGLPQGARTIWAPAHRSNYYSAADRPYGGAPRRQLAICYHTPEEQPDDIETTPAWFQDPAANASTGYYADSDGDLYQMVRDADFAWAQGTRTRKRPNTRLPRPSWWRAELVSYNTCMLSIEIEGWARSIGRTFTPRLAPIPGRRRLVRLPVPQARHPARPRPPPRPQRTLHHQRRPRPPVPLGRAANRHRRPAEPIQHQPARRGAGAPARPPPNPHPRPPSPLERPLSRPDSAASPARESSVTPRKPRSATPAQDQLRHTARESSVIPALAAGIPPRPAPSPVPASLRTAPARSANTPQLPTLPPCPPTISNTPTNLPATPPATAHLTKVDKTCHCQPPPQSQNPAKHGATANLTAPSTSLSSLVVNPCAGG